MTRNGKIARLPAAIREELNHRLLDGEEGKNLVEWLNGLPAVQAMLKAKFEGKPITEVNLSQWKNGGYAAWEAGERLADNVKSILDGTTSLQKVAQHGLTDRMTLIMAATMAVQMQRLESMPEGSEKAKIWHELRMGLLSLRRSELYARRLDIERDTHAKPDKKKKGPAMTPEERQHTLMQMLGINEGYDGSIHPELTRPPAVFQPAPVQASTSQYK
jgi:dTDP-4-amino-4,6-dideoxygalactose transaminase